MKQRFVFLICAGLLSACVSGVGGEKPRQMEVVAPSRLPPELRQAALAPPPVPADLDAEGNPIVPAAPQMQSNYYDTRAGISSLDPIVITENRAPRGTPDEKFMASPARQEAKAVPAVLAAADAAQMRGMTTSATTASKPEPMPERRAVPAAATGAYAVHLASYREEDKARVGWDIYAARYGDMLSSLTPRGAHVSIPEQGEFVRLLAGPFPNSDAAQSVCDELSYQDQYCRVMPYEGAPLL